MAHAPEQNALRVLTGRDAPFSYSCAGCNRCCHDKRIQVGPYEIARLAAASSLTTTAFIERYTDDGCYLRFEDGACTFLTPKGCSVHAARPLVCRLYPLGRVALPDGGEQVVELRAHPETEGTYGTTGTVAEYFEQQGVAPYVQAARLYYELLERVVELLDQSPVDGNADADDAATAQDDSEEPPSLTDIDAVVTTHCKKTDQPVPSELWEKMLLHIAVVDAWLTRNRLPTDRVVVEEPKL
ncbi:MAG TPA: YkgJ family cysteine cluster protein [Polyangiaceae bacterium]|nr:YkgJ family cysteine cluster protein [Polyangiaceae bacterium]HMR74935.1 YkgJ family cysteine cluster protein [Polyangiaceae bacterium]